MRKELITFLPALLLPFVAVAANEGVPVYYQQAAAANSNQINYGQYANQGYTKYVGTSGNKQIVGSRVTTYTVERPKVQNDYLYSGYAASSGMTVNGIAMVPEIEYKTNLYADYTRRFANFDFRTGVNSVLKWDDMVFDEITVGARHNFSLRNFDMFAFGEYSYGNMSHGGLSMDYDLEPYDWANPTEGIFTISVGDQSGESQHLRLGIGARNIWDIAGWKLSPVFGYEIFKHDLKMSDHLYPNQGIYLPLMTNMGEYVYGDEQGNYYSLPIDVLPPDTWYQVCMGPEDIKVVVQTGSTSGVVTALGDTLVTTDYTSTMGDVPWGVYGGECVIIGGDGPIKVGGVTHIYNTTWSGFYVGLEVEKQMTLSDKLRFYFQVSLPKYSSEGIWPNRTDWQQSPSFLDEGSNGAYAYAAEMEYNLRLSPRLQLAVKVDTNTFHVGNISGKLYVAQYTDFVVDENGQYVLDDNGLPYLETVPAHTEYVSNALKQATWQSFGLHLGVKFAF
jgi:hypothetical protein